MASFDHAAALHALLTAHPERAVQTVEAVIDSLPTDLDYADVNSVDVADALLVALTAELAEESIGE
ncbi:hypothetical protein SEA_SICARIUS2_63 [Arthrobacter phage Sicarius2]|uniref:Uncharacterized protein n=1 Tax=Arthrobacter phage Sicarius2 TaxID=2836090 RepID=A0A8F3INJ4_9CAUD|nr:hypothetical protein SEA_SICARIUS2_63 [Arthrobacter phage Sicarius2]